MQTNNLLRFLIEKSKTVNQFSKFIIDDLAIAKKAVKFMLPVNGTILNSNLKGVPSEFRLPFPNIVIEFDNWVDIETTEYFSNKKINASSVMGEDLLEKVMVIAKQVGDKIELRHFSFIKGKSPEDNVLQAPGFTIFIPCSWEDDLSSYLDRLENPNTLMDINEATLEKDAKELRGRMGNDYHSVVKIIYIRSIGAVLSLIEALSCKNVGHEALPVRKLNKSAAKRGALPFDEYRVLTINAVGTRGGSSGGTTMVDRHTPREHLRRGHIRTYQSGLKIWVQSTVVNAGIGSSINKDYKVK